LQNENVPPSKHVTVLIASLIALHSAQAQFATIVTGDSEAFTSENTATSTAVAVAHSSAPVVAQSTITSAAQSPALQQPAISQPSASQPSQNTRMHRLVSKIVYTTLNLDLRPGYYQNF
jgi:hypothetical protein